MWAQVNELLFKKYFGTRPVTPLHNLYPSKPIFTRPKDGWTGGWLSACACLLLKNTNSSNLVRNSPTSLCTVSRETVRRLMVHFNIAGQIWLLILLQCKSSSFEQSSQSSLTTFSHFLLMIS